MAKKPYDKPVVIVTQDEADAKSNGFATAKKTWKFKAEMVRDFGFATSRRWIWDMMAVKIGDRDVMAVVHKYVSFVFISLYIISNSTLV